jgi:hypothetical protein
VRHRPLQAHPDKGGDAASFARLKSAYETISDPAALVQWQRSQGGSCGGASASETVDIDSMAFDAAGCCFTHACRCGDNFVVPEHMLDMRCAGVGRACARRAVY